MDNNNEKNSFICSFTLSNDAYRWSVYGLHSIQLRYRADTRYKLWVYFFLFSFAIEQFSQTNQKYIYQHRNRHRHTLFFSPMSKPTNRSKKKTHKKKRATPRRTKQQAENNSAKKEHAYWVTSNRNTILRRVQCTQQRWLSNAAQQWQNHFYESECYIINGNFLEFRIEKKRTKVCVWFQRLLVSTALTLVIVDALYVLWTVIKSFNQKNISNSNQSFWGGSTRKLTSNLYLSEFPFKSQTKIRCR